MLVISVQYNSFQSCRDVFPSSWAEPVLSRDKRVLLKDTKTVPHMNLKLATLRSQVKHPANWATELLMCFENGHNYAPYTAVKCYKTFER